MVRHGSLRRRDEGPELNDCSGERARRFVRRRLRFRPRSHVALSTTKSVFHSLREIGPLRIVGDARACRPCCALARTASSSTRATEPRHVHVERDDAVAKFWLEPVRLERSSGFGSAELRRIRRLVLANRDTILRAWYAYFTD